MMLMTVNTESHILYIGKVPNSVSVQNSASVFAKDNSSLRKYKKLKSATTQV